MEDEHLNTIPATESDEVIKSSVEELVLIPSESEGISDGVCDVPLRDNPTPLKDFKDHSEIVVDSNDDDTSSDDDDFEDIEYVDASSLDSELVSLEEVNDIDQEEKEFDLEDILQIQDVILREKLLNINRLIANIESLKDNPSPDRVLKSPSSVPISITDSGSFFEESDTSLSHLNNSLPEFKLFRVVAVPLLMLIFLNMSRSSLIFQSIRFLLPIGVIFIMRSSSMNSLTSYLHQ
ncbi:hypothetical protein Tco_0076887, partial [Tanacetum coccineum]